MRICVALSESEPDEAHDDDGDISKRIFRQLANRKTKIASNQTELEIEGG